MSIEHGVRIVNRSRGTTVADRVETATSFWARGRGLIGRRHLPDGFGLVIKPCTSIHALFMSYPIDALYVDRAGTVLKAFTIKPWRVGPLVLRSAWVVELPAETAARSATRVGDVAAVLDARGDACL